MGALAHVLARLLTIAWVALLAVASLALLVYCLDGPHDTLGLGSGRPDRLLHLAHVREGVGDRLDTLGAPGGLAVLGLVGGLAVIVLGVILLVGLLASPRERLLILDDGDAGVLGVRRRAARQLLSSLVGDTRGVRRVRSVRVRPAWRGRGGTARVVVWRARSVEAGQVERRALEAVAPVAEPLELRIQVAVSLGERGGRMT